MLKHTKGKGAHALRRADSAQSCKGHHGIMKLLTSEDVHACHKARCLCCQVCGLCAHAPPAVRQRLHQLRCAYQTRAWGLSS
eukprot:881769-Pelagomonas_calceolata.AAC.4